MGKHWNENELDAFGHLNWTVGNEDWIACFDAIRKGNTVEYHVVVDCESGGWVDTISSGSVPLSEAVEKLSGLPEHFFEIAEEHYAGDDIDNPDSPYHLSPAEMEKTKAAWKQHLESLIKEGE